MNHFLIPHSGEGDDLVVISFHPDGYNCSTADHHEMEQPVPLKIDRVIRECLLSLQALCERQEVVFNFAKDRAVESALVAEGPLRSALQDLLQACLHACRPRCEQAH